MEKRLFLNTESQAPIYEALEKFRENESGSLLMCLGTNMEKAIRNLRHFLVSSVSALMSTV